MSCLLVTLPVKYFLCCVPALWRVVGALAAGAAVAATFSVGARDLLALDASAGERWMSLPLARDVYARVQRYHISSGCAQHTRSCAYLHLRVSQDDHTRLLEHFLGEYCWGVGTSLHISFRHAAPLRACLG